MHRKYRLDRSSRINRKQDFQSIFNQGERLTNAYFIFCYRISGRNKPRLGLVVNKRSARLAVNRNRIKRLNRETFRLRQHQLKAIDLIVIAKQQIDKAENPELLQCLNKLYDKLNDCCKSYFLD